MKKLTIKVIALLLAFIFVAFATMACTIKKVDDETSGVDSTTKAEATETESQLVKDGLADVNMNGTEFRILSYLNDFTHGNSISEQVTGDVLNDAIYKTTIEIENRFNVELVETIESSSYVNTESKVWAKAGTDEYDYIVILDRSGLSWAQEGLAVRYDNLPNIDLSKPYWDAGINKSVSINNNYFMAAGAANLTVYDYTNVLLFNKEMIENNNLDNPYTLVDTNQWTFEKFDSMMQEVLADNGDGVANELDTYGFVTVGKQILPNMWVAANEKSVTKDENDIPYFSIFDSDKFLEVYDTVLNTMYDHNCWYQTTNSSNTWYNDIQLFESNQALFAGHTFYTAGDMRQRISEFGIIPYPKYEETQDNYYSRVSGGIRMMLVPITNTRLEDTSTIIEAINCAAYNYEVPAYYDVVLKSKTANDEESARMLDIVLANRVYDLGDSYWYSIIRSSLFTTLFLNNNQSPVSTIRSCQTAIDQQIANDIKPFE